jgi:hypothetical protein
MSKETVVKVDQCSHIALAELEVVVGLKQTLMG